MDDLSSDSEGRDVLRQRLVDKRQELGFLRQMIELSPEMVAVIFHEGFRFKQPAVMEQLLDQDTDELPGWSTLTEVVELAPWAQALADVLLAEPKGEWFMAVAAGLVYMHDKPDASRQGQGDDDTDGDDDNSDDNEGGLHDAEDEDARAREQAGADWMVEQGFDAKD